ncbi:TBC1 domain family member 5 [Aricia agestis]|uniref:TBC1 domain family member 5 n=1 Tax=Aricia agestis TaxID=91739 RepID=UPI001C2095BA|nr:TBC1 domain family member 5 [Aricia agestis]
MEQHKNKNPSTITLNNFVDAIDYDLQFPTWSMEYLKKAATNQKLVRPHSLAWAILLNAIPPPSGDIVISIKGHRNFYNDLRAKLSMDPRNVIGDDPLSQSDKSAWKQHFCDNELKALILQDVVRTYPDEAYFRDKDVQDMMVRMLFFWARTHPCPGYRQGMHEILAPLMYELHMDRIHAPSLLSDTLQQFLDEKYLEHDSYMLFSAVMKGLERFYTTGDVVPTPTGRLPTSKTVHNQNEAVKYLQFVKEEYLMKLDPELAIHLDECGISMELFGIRWLRLLFGREFPRADIPQLWGFLFADGPMLPNIHYFILAMLMSIRDTLLSCDTGGALSVLMRAARVRAAYAAALALHLAAPRTHPAPPPPSPPTPPVSMSSSITDARGEEEGVEWSGSEAGDGPGGVSEGVAEGGDVARALGTLALLRARLPPAARALRAALPRPPPNAAHPLNQILQLAALLECRNHSLIDVETALEAAENQNTDEVGRRVIVPVVVNNRQREVKVRNNKNNKPVQVKKIKEVPLKVFHQAECHSATDFPFLDPLRLRTE